ncbi:MAG: HNH endonuclease [Sulfurovaceae bacterium]|nr:HNH endonuclease [Sulfurovaceae bacterium]MDD5407055.1 HNH endonuclease [Sulfurovaceae bacterium]
MSRISENQLILPALYLMDISPNKTILIADMKKALYDIFKPTGEDNEILHNRQDTRFAQKAGNLKSHNTLVNLGYAVYTPKVADERSGRFTLTEAGKAFLDANINIVNYLLNNDFTSEDLKESFDVVFSDPKRAMTIETFDEDLTINEGKKKVVKTAVYERSDKLRKKAIDHYTDGGRIKCKVCCFDFEDFYGDHGKGFIEIHHQKPVFMFADEDLEQKIEDAIENVMPVCPNCHRMIHRTRNNPLSFEEIKAHVRNDLDFCDNEN